MEIEFVCLANSWREGGRCVAGVRLDGEGWIRPVISPEGGPLQQRHYRLDAGRSIALLDHVRVSVTGRSALPYHPENWLLKEGDPWELLDKIGIERAGTILKPYFAGDPLLFGNDARWCDSSDFQSRPSESSLALISPSDLRWTVIQSWGKRKCRAQFRLGNVSYNLPVTDPEWDSRLLRLENGSHATQEVNDGNDANVVLTISLGAPFALQGNRCYKIVAGVMLL